MPEEEQNFSAAMRVARRSVWEQAKAAGIQNDETPPPVPTGKETGLNDDPRIATLEGIVRDLAGRLDDLEDDYPEPEIGNGGGGSIYSSYFKVIDASTTYGETVTPKIRIFDGHDDTSPYCGPVAVNGVECDPWPSLQTVELETEEDEVLSQSVWICAYVVSSDGVVNAEIVLSPAVERPLPTNNAYAFIPILVAIINPTGGMSFSVHQEHYGPIDIHAAFFSGNVWFTGVKSVIGPPRGKYLTVNIVTGETEYSDVPVDVDIWNSYEVARLAGGGEDAVYEAKMNRVCGDVRVDLSPYAQIPGGTGQT